MGALAATAQRGRVARGGLLARSAWRLLALLGFACAAVILFSTAANADSGTTIADPVPASKPGLVPGLLKVTNAVLRPTLANLSGHRATGGTPASPDADLPGVVPVHHVASSGTTAGHSVLPILATVASAPSGIRSATTAPATLSLHDALTPITAAATHQLSETVDVLSGSTSSSLPVLGLATKLLRDAGTATTGTVVSVIGSLTAQVDAQLAPVTATVGGLVAPLTGGGSKIASAPPATSPSGSSAPTAAAGVPDATAPVVVDDLWMLPSMTTSALTGSARGVTPAPPQSVHAVAAVQSAPSAVAAYAAPVFGAAGIATGSVPGPAAGGASGGHEQTEVPRGFDYRAVMAIGRPAATIVRPLPGTPLVDPGFSPD